MKCRVCRAGTDLHPTIISSVEDMEFVECMCEVCFKRLEPLNRLQYYLATFPDIDAELLTTCVLYERTAKLVISKELAYDILERNPNYWATIVYSTTDGAWLVPWTAPEIVAVLKQKGKM